MGDGADDALDAMLDSMAESDFERLHSYDYSFAQPRQPSAFPIYRPPATTTPWTRLPSILLCPNVPKPLHGLVPREILGTRWWDDTRHAAYASTDYHCIACGVPKADALVHKWLEGHELYAINYKRGRMTYRETIPLCHLCHNFIHSGRLHMLLQAGTITAAQYHRVLEHGERVLKAAGLAQPLPYTGPCAEWGDWRLVVSGMEYAPKFKTYEEWERAYRQ
jgi:hypothetical protein